MDRFRAFIFDLDGVLIDSSPCHTRAFDDLWQKIGIDGPDYFDIAGRRTQEAIGVVTSLEPTSLQVEEWTEFKQQRAREYLATSEIAFADSAACVEELARQGLDLALATSARREAAESALRRLGIFELFPILVTSEDVENGKPSPEVFLQAQQRLGVEPARAVVVEDSGTGLEAARDSGAWFACVRTGRQLDHSRFLGSFADLQALLAEVGILPP